jgi:hypothetical protein
MLRSAQTGVASATEQASFASDAIDALAHKLLRARGSDTFGI